MKEEEEEEEEEYFKPDTPLCFERHPGTADRSDWFSRDLDAILSPVYDWSLFPNERKSMDEFLRKRIISDKTPLPVLPALLKQWRALVNPGTEIQLVAEFLAEIQVSFPGGKKPKNHGLKFPKKKSRSGLVCHP